MNNQIEGIPVEKIYAAGKSYCETFRQEEKGDLTFISWGIDIYGLNKKGYFCSRFRYRWGEVVAKYRNIYISLEIYPYCAVRKIKEDGSK